MRLVYGPGGSCVEACGLRLWRWLTARANERWPGADVRYRAHFGTNHRQWRILLPSGESLALAVTEELLDRIGFERARALIDESGWLDRRPSAGSVTFLLMDDGSLVEWKAHEGVTAT